MKDVRSLRVLVKEVGKRPKACSLDVPFGAAQDDLRSAVSNVVLGPEDERWTKVNEQTKEDLDRKHGGGTIHVTTKYEAQELQLWTHPHDDCCPMQRVELKNLPPELDVYALLAGPAALTPSPLDDGPALRAWWASLPRGRHALRSCAEQRLQAKASVPAVAVLPVLRRKPKDSSSVTVTPAPNQDDGSLREGERGENKEGEGSGEGEGNQHLGAPQQGLGDSGQQPESSAKDVASAGAKESLAAGGGAKPEERGGKTARPPSSRKAPAAAAAASGKAPQEGRESMEGEAEEEGVEEAKHTHLEMGPIQRVEEEVEAVMVEMEVPWNLRHDLMLESMQGLWEMATRDRPFPITFSPDTLAVLVHGLESGVLEVMSIAAAAVWVVAAKADQRSALVQLGAVEALAGAALIGHTERAHLCRTKQEAAVVEAAHKHEVAAVAETVAEKAEADAQKAIKWAARGIGGAAAEVAKDEAIAKAEAAKTDAAAMRTEAEAAAEYAAEVAHAAASAASDEAEGVEGEQRVGNIKAGGVEWNEEKRAMLLLCNRVVYHCLGALGIMAVDQKARAMALQVSPTLKFLSHLAVAEFPPPPSLDSPLAPVKPKDNLEQEQEEGTQSQEPGAHEPMESPEEVKTTDKKADQGPDVPPHSTSQAQKSAGDKDHAASNGEPTGGGNQLNGAQESTEQAQEHEGDSAAEGEQPSNEADDAEDGKEEAAGSASDELMPEDDVLVQQKMAVEVLYAMLGRDRDVRASLAQNDGLKDLLELTGAASGDVRSVALLCLNAYARDASPPAHATGHDMLARSGQALTLVHGLLGALDDLLDIHRLYPPEEHTLGLEKHPLLVVVETTASALWGAVAAQVSAECLSWEPNPSTPDPSKSSRRSSGSESQSKQFTYDDTSLLARAAGRLVALLQDMESHQQQEIVKADDSKSERSEARQDLDPPHALISNAPFYGQYGGHSSASCTAVSLYCILASLAIVHSTPVLTARTHAHMTQLHINLQQLQEGTGAAKEALDSHVSQMISKRTASKFFIDDDDDAQHAKELESALLAAHEDVHNMQKRIEDVEEALQGGCEECLAAAQDAMRLRLHLVQPSRATVTSAHSAEGSSASAGPSQSSMQDHSQGSASEDGAEAMGQCLATNKDGNELMGRVHLAAAAMVTALAQTAHPALQPTAVDPSPLFLGPFRALLRCNGVLKDLIALVMSCHTCTGGPLPPVPPVSTTKHKPRARSTHVASEGDGHQEGGENSSQGPEASAPAHDARAASRPASAAQHERAKDVNNTGSRPASALPHGRVSRVPSRRPSTASFHSGGGRTPSSAQLSHRSHASDAPSMANSQSRGGGLNASTKPGSKDAGAGNTNEASAGEHDVPPLGVPPPIHDPPPLTPVAIATRLVVAAGVVHLLASDEPVGQHQLWQLLAYMQHQSATANAGSALLSDLIAQAEQEMNDEELLAANQGQHDSETETDTSYNRTAMAHSEAVQGVRRLHAALGACEALAPFMAACMWCLCRHENSRRGLIVGDSEAWIALIEGWLSSGVEAVNQHHCFLHPGLDGFYTRPPQTARSPAAQSTGEAGSKGQSKGAGNSRSDEENVTAEEGHQMFASLGRRSQWGGGSASSSGEVDERPDMVGPSHSERPPLSVTNQQGFEFGGFAPFGLGSLTLAPARPSRSAAAASSQVRNSIMSLWLLLRQWLTNNLSPMNMLRSCNGLFVVGGPSWWQLPLSINTPLPLTSAVARGLHAMMDTATALPDNHGSNGGALREMTMRSCWNLSVSHPAVEERLVNLGNALLALATATSPTASSSLRVVAINYIMSLTSTPAHVEAMGGLVQVAGMLAKMVDKALSSDAAGRGADLAELEAATRGMARLGLSSKGRHALKRCGCIRRLVRVAHADNVALEEVSGRRMEADVPVWENTLELMAPLRAINNAMPTAPTAAQQHVEIALKGAAHDVGSVWGAEVGGLGWEGTQLLPFEHPALPAETQKSAAEVAAAALAAAGTVPSSSTGEGTDEASRSSQDGAQGQHLAQGDGNSCSNGHAHGSGEEEVGGDADVGLMSLWALLNLSNYEPAQVSICRHGLYTLLRMVHRSMDPRRRSSAAAILTNIHFHPGNATTLYKAEIKLKFAALLRLRGLSQEARKAKLQKLPLQIKPNSMKAKSLAQSVASKSSPKKQAGREGPGAQGGATGTRRSSAQEKSTKGARALATSQLEKGLQQMQASMTKDEAPPEDQQAPRSPFLMGGRDAVESESGSAVEDPTALEAKLAFLCWVVEPDVQVLGDQPAPEELGAGDLAGGAGVTTADLMSRITNDPEEEAWLAHIRSVAAMDDFEQMRYVQGDYLRGNLTRSLAEGAQSLWQSRAALGPASPSPKPSPHASPQPATANLFRSSKTAAVEKTQGNSSPRTAAHPEDESSGAAPSPNAPSNTGKKSSAKKGSTQGSNGPHSHARSTAANPLRSGSGRAKKAEAGGASKGEGEEVDGGVSRNGTNIGLGPGREEDGGASGGGNKKHRGTMRTKGKTSSATPQNRPSTAPPTQTGLRGAIGEALRPATGSLPMWSPHIKGYIQDRNKAGKPSHVLTERLLRAGIPEATTGHLASLADEILENKTVKQGRRAAEEAVAAAAAARKAAEEEAEAERLREAGIAEELQVLDLTRFDSIRSLNRRRSSMGRARFSSFAGAQGAPSECSESDGAQPKRRMSRSMSRALSVAVVRASQRGEARAADRAAEYAANAADAAEAARLPARKMVRRGSSSKRTVPNDSTSTRQNSSTNNSTTPLRTSFASSVSEAGWPKPMVNSSLEEAANEEEDDDNFAGGLPTTFTNQEGSRPPSAMKKASRMGPQAGDEKGAARDDPEAKSQTRLHRQTTVRFGKGGSSSDDPDIPALQRQDESMPQEGTQVGVHIGEEGQTDEAGRRLSNTEYAAERAVAAMDPRAQASPRSRNAAPTRGSASFVASSLVQIGTLSSMPQMAPWAAANQGRPSSLRGSTTNAQPAPGHSQMAQQHQGLALGVDGSVPEAKEGGEEDPGDELSPQVRAALQGPIQAPYHIPYVGSTRPTGQTLSSLKRDLHHEAWEAVAFPARAAAREKFWANRSTLASHVPKPVTTLSVDASDLIALKHAEKQLKAMVHSDDNSVPRFDYQQIEDIAREQHEKVQGELPVKVKLATGDGGPDRVYHFDHNQGYDPRHLVMFEHVEGATFCESLYGHYLLPNGKLAHFALGDTVRKGHKVDLVAPPAIPFSALDWLHAPGGPLPTTKAFAEWSLPGTRHSAYVLAPLWCPVPTLGPDAPTIMEGGTPMLQWKDLSSPVQGHEAMAAAEGEKAPMLALRSVCIAATLHRVTRITKEITTVAPKPKVVHKKKKKPAGAGRGSPVRR